IFERKPHELATALNFRPIEQLVTHECTVGCVMPTPAEGSAFAAIQARRPWPGQARSRSSCFHRSPLARVNEPHAFLAADNAIASGGLCFIEPPVGNVEERFVVSAVARTMGDTDADREPAFGPAPAGCDAASNALGQRPSHGVIV